MDGQSRVGEPWYRILSLSGSTIPPVHRDPGHRCIAGDFLTTLSLRVFCLTTRYCSDEGLK